MQLPSHHPGLNCLLGRPSGPLSTPSTWGEKPAKPSPQQQGLCGSGAPASSCEGPLQDQELHVHIPISSFQLSLHLPVGTDEDKDSGKLGGALRQWLPTPVFLPEEFHAQGSLVGCSPWGYKRAGNDLATKQLQQQDSLQGHLEGCPVCYLAALSLRDPAESG